MVGSVRSTGGGWGVGAGFSRVPPVAELAVEGEF